MGESDPNDSDPLNQVFASFSRVTHAGYSRVRGLVDSLDDEDDENGASVIIAGFYVVGESDDEELELDSAQVAALVTTGETESSQTT